MIQSSPMPTSSVTAKHGWRSTMENAAPSSASAYQIRCSDEQTEERYQQIEARPTISVGLRQCQDRKSTRLNSSHLGISYAVFCLKKKKTKKTTLINGTSHAAFSINRNRASGKCASEYNAKHLTTSTAPESRKVCRSVHAVICGSD